MRRVFMVVLMAAPLALLPLTSATAKDDGNKGGSSAEHRNDANAKNKRKGGQTTGTGTPDDGDDMHASGKDRSVENGGSHPQGNSSSDPDGMSNGGADEPGGTGGIDQEDQDGNNGCGNDDDFEDDNNGRCLGLLKQAFAEQNAVLGGEVVEFAAFAAAFGVPSEEPKAIVTDAVAAAAAASEADEVQVLGTRFSRGDAADAAVSGAASDGSVLPLSGMGVTALLVVSIALIAVGLASIRLARAS